MINGYFVYGHVDLYNYTHPEGPQPLPSPPCHLHLFLSTESGRSGLKLTKPRALETLSALGFLYEVPRGLNSGMMGNWSWANTVK